MIIIFFYIVHHQNIKLRLHFMYKWQSELLKCFNEWIKKLYYLIKIALNGLYLSAVYDQLGY